MIGYESILYVGAYLPRLSETFVYREIFALRQIGRPVVTASLHAPDTFGEDQPEIRRLAAETVVVYGGWLPLLGDAAAEWLLHPLRSIRTLCLAVRDACRERDLSAPRRLLIPGQALAAQALARRIRPQGISHIHAHMAHAPTTVAMYTAFQLGIRFSFTGHAVDLFRDRALLRCKLQRAAFAACISTWHRSFYQSLVHRPDSAYPVIRCGVDPDDFTPVERSDDRPPLILGVGRMVPKKGFDVLLEALEKTKAHGAAFRGCIVGDGEELPRLTELRRSLDLEDEVVLPGARPNPEIRTLMQQAGLFVLPCRVDAAGDRDGIPVVLMEAMACGICVISGDLPTIRELVQDGVTGFMVPPGDTEALAERVTALLRDPALRKRIGRQGRARVEEEFSLHRNAARLNEAFDHLNHKQGEQNHE